MIAVRFQESALEADAWIILVSILASIIWILIITAGVLNTTISDS